MTHLLFLNSLSFFLLFCFLAQKYAAEAADCQSSPNLASIAANIGTPEVSFPFDEGSGTTPVNQGTLAGDVAAELVGADWTFDTLLNKNVSDQKEEEEEKKWGLCLLCA